MQCRQCGFENMPGLERCGRCSSVLAVRGQIVVTPPRATGPLWLRRAGYRFRAVLWRPLFRSPAVPPPAAATSAPAQPPLWPGLVSALPGLGHLLTHRLRRVRWWWAGWLGCLLAGLVLYGSSPGEILLGTAVGLHAWIVCDAAQIDRRLDSAWRRISVSLLVFFLLIVGLYMPVRHAAGEYLFTIPCAMDIEAAGIREGDVLLLARRAYRTGAPLRGDVVAYTIAGYGRPEQFMIRPGDVISTVVALPGDVVTAGQDRITVYRADGTSSEHRVPPLPVGGDFETTVPPGSCFCLPPPFSPMGRGGARPPFADFVRSVCMPSAEAVRGRALMVWDPIWRRHWIGRSPTEDAG